MNIKNVFTALLFAFLQLSSFAQTPNKGYQPGDVVQDFKLKNVDGKMVSMADYKSAKGIILIFTCNHCPYAKAYESRIIDLHKKYKDTYPVIAINPNDPVREPEDSYVNMQKLAKEKKYPFAYVFDATQDVAKQYGAQRTPHVYLLKKNGKEWVVHYIGAIDDNYEVPEAVTERYVEKAIAELEVAGMVTRQTTKAIGCGIKWKK